MPLPSGSDATRAFIDDSRQVIAKRQAITRRRNFNLEREARHCGGFISMVSLVHTTEA